MQERSPTAQRQTLDYHGPWCLLWEIGGSHWDPAGHHQAIKTLTLWRRPPLTVRHCPVRRHRGWDVCSEAASHSVPVVQSRTAENNLEFPCM